MTKGRIVNKKTRQYLTGKRTREPYNNRFDFRIDGATSANIFQVSDWDFEPEEPELRIWLGSDNTIYQKRRGEPPTVSLYGGGEWRPAVCTLDAIMNAESIKLIYSSEDR